MNDEALAAIAEEIKVLHRAGERLRALGAAHAFPAVEYNAKRLLAVVEMLELNVRDGFELIGPGDHGATQHSE